MLFEACEVCKHFVCEGVLYCYNHGILKLNVLYFSIMLLYASDREKVSGSKFFSPKNCAPMSNSFGSQANFGPLATGW